MAIDNTKKGKIVAVSGSIVDVAFSPENMPYLQTALHIDRDKKSGGRLTLEVAQLLICRTILSLLPHRLLEQQKFGSSRAKSGKTVKSFVF